jgi:hypothetical protein
MCAYHSRWSCSPNDLVGLNPTRARDLVVECFFQAQHETMARSNEAMGLDTNPSTIRMEAEGAVRVAFKRTGGDFRHPSKASLRRAVDSLADCASTYGTPPDVIEHHKRQIGMVLSGLPD